MINCQPQVNFHRGRHLETNESHLHHEAHIKTLNLPGMVAHACNPSTWETEARGLLRGWHQPELQSETLSPKNKHPDTMGFGELPVWGTHGCGERVSTHGVLQLFVHVLLWLSLPCGLYDILYNKLVNASKGISMFGELVIVAKIHPYRSRKYVD